MALKFLHSAHSFHGKSFKCIYCGLELFCETRELFQLSLSLASSASLTKARTRQATSYIFFIFTSSVLNRDLTWKHYIAARYDERSKLVHNSDFVCEKEIQLPKNNKVFVITVRRLHEFEQVSQRWVLSMKFWASRRIRMRITTRF